MPIDDSAASRSLTANARRVAILLCTKNGAEFLGEQLRSIADQTHADWSLFVSDDGSTDTTKDIVDRFAKDRPQQVVMRDGPHHGPGINFLSLAVDPIIEADCFAFADQDDIWHRDKLERAVDWLATVPEAIPAVYCGRTELASADGTAYGLSTLFTRPPSFANALVQSLGGGNTMVFNKAAKRLVEAVGPVEIVLHDWWLYQLVSAAGGSIHYDPRPMIKYRQHDDNIMGSNLGRNARVWRIRMLLQGRFRRMNDINVAALSKIPRSLFKPEHQATLQLFLEARNGGLLKRLRYLRRSGVYRQTFMGTLGLLVGTILRRI